MTAVRARLVTLVGAALAAVLLSVHVTRLAEASGVELRELRVQAQRLERQARLLDAPDAPSTLAALLESRDALRVRLVESLEAARRAPGVARLRHRVEERPVPGEAGAATLRLLVEGRVAHAAALLDVLAAVRAAARPWPEETRGCLVQRLELAPAPDDAQRAEALSVDCAIDILHWTALRAPHAG